MRQLAPRQRTPREAAVAPAHARRHAVRVARTLKEATLSQAPFLNRQALYLRPDPARVVVRPFKPATEPRDLNPTDKTRANHIVDRVLALDAGDGRASARRGAREFQGRHRNLLATFEARADEMEEAFAAHATFTQDAASAGRRLFPARVFLRSSGAVQSEHRRASRSVRRARREACASS